MECKPRSSPAYSGAIMICSVPLYAPARAEPSVAARMTIVRLALALGPLLQNWWLAVEVKPDEAVPAISVEPLVWPGESAQRTSYGNGAEPDSSKAPPLPLPTARTE